MNENLNKQEREQIVELGSDITKTLPAETEFRQYPYDNAEGIRHDDTIQEGRDGYQVKSYSVRYDRATDQKLSSDYIATSNYEPVKYIYAVVTQHETTPPTEPETTAPPESSTLPSEETESIPEFSEAPQDDSGVEPAA